MTNLDITREAIGLRIEQHLEAAEALIAALDAAETDPDIEDGGDAEASLGWPEAHTGMGADALRLVGDDLELEDENDEETDFLEEVGDDEPWLGWATKYDQGVKVGVNAPIDINLCEAD